MKLYHIHRVYEAKLQRIQKLSKDKPKTSKKPLRKYSRRERNRARDFMHKLTTAMARELRESNSGAIMKKLKGVKHRVLNKSKEWNRKISKWDARIFQLCLNTSLDGWGYQ